MQNAVDAITARRLLDPATRAEVRFEPPETDGGALRVHDSGVGLTEAQVHDLLATIGRSGKRDELGFARHEFLGQFGIGLLSCFLVADEIEVLTRSADQPTVRWVGYSDGRYEIELAAHQRAATGTTVTLRPRRGAEHWLSGRTVSGLARLYGSLLPVDVHVGQTLVTDGPPPWHPVAGESPTLRRHRLLSYGREVFGFTPYDVIDLAVPTAGLTGVAFVLPHPANPATRSAHRVYLKRMLLAENVPGLLPEWAFFVRCVIDTTELSPTASREALYENSLLEEARESLGIQLRGWLIRLAETDPRRLAEFLDIHHLGVKALALHDDEMLRLVDGWWPMRTNHGPMTLSEFRSRYGVVRYCAGLDEFRQVSSVAAAQGVALVNGGYTYDSEIIERLPALDPRIRVERMEPADLATRFDTLDPEAELAARAFRNLARSALDRLDCEVVVRGFEPANVPALYLVSRGAAFRAELRQTRERVDDVWADVLNAFDSTAADERPQLMVNWRNPLVRKMATLADPKLVALAVESLYGQALLLGHHPLRPADLALLNSSFLGLLHRAVGE
jgi:molecular chaperone HtpG